MAKLSKKLKRRIVVAVTSEQYGKELIDAIEGGAGTGVSIWGSIEGNIVDQADLSIILDDKVAKSGDTMTGQLILSADPDTNLGAGIKQI